MQFRSSTHESSLPPPRMSLAMASPAARPPHDDAPVAPTAARADGSDHRASSSVRRSDRAQAAARWPHVMLAALLTIALGFATGVADVQLTLIVAGVALLGLGRVMRAHARQWTRETRRTDGIAPAGGSRE